jgi:hypothetical protein
MASAGIVEILRMAFTSHWKSPLYFSLSPLGYVANMLRPGELDETQRFLGNLSVDWKRHPRFQHSTFPATRKTWK